MCNTIETEGQRLNARYALINIRTGGGSRQRQQMEMATKEHELCAAVKTIKIYKGQATVGREGQGQGGQPASATSVRASVWHIKRQYLLWLHLQMEHYENKQIFINDKYKGCSGRQAGWRGRRSGSGSSRTKGCPI